MALESDQYYALRVGYRTLLNGQITINGTAVPVYASIKQIASTAKYYILIESQASAGVNSKVTTETSTLVQISLFAKGSDLTGNEIEDMAAQVMAIIEPTPGYCIPINTNFQNIEQRVVTDQPMPIRVLDTISQSYERNIIIQHRIKHHLRSLI